jgi:hypothetical protein
MIWIISRTVCAVTALRNYGDGSGPVLRLRIQSSACTLKGACPELRVRYWVYRQADIVIECTRVPVGGRLFKALMIDKFLPRILWSNWLTIECP